VSEFLRNAENILDGASAAMASGGPLSDVAILVGRDGAIRIVSDPDAPLESLGFRHGARMAYRVSGSAGRVRVEGRAGAERCVLITEHPASVARRLLHCTVCIPFPQAPCLPSACH